MPRDCACWVRLRGFLVFVWRVCFRAFRMSGAVVDAPLAGCFSACVARASTRRLLFVGCVLPCRVLPVCCDLFCLSDIVWVCVS